MTINARRALTALFIILLACSASSAPRQRHDPNEITATILCYHIVGAPAAPRMHIDRATFLQQLQYIEANGFTVIPLRHVYELMTGERKSIPKNAIAITFDDGWRSTYTEAFPELLKRGYPFTVFIYPNIIGKTHNALSWSQIKEMSDAGVDVQSHALTHPYLTRRHHAGMTDDQYAEWVRNELAESKRILERKTGQKVEFLAYPYGAFDDGVARIASEVGYTAAFTCSAGRIRRGTNRWKMRRVVVVDDMDFATFRKYLGAPPVQTVTAPPPPLPPVTPRAAQAPTTSPHGPRQP